MPEKSSLDEPREDDDLDRMVVEIGSRLAELIIESLPSWVSGCVERVMGGSDGELSSEVEKEEVLAAALEAGRWAADLLGEQIRFLLASDVDEQRTTPLEIVRAAVVYPTAVLRVAGVKASGRDSFAVERFPDDDYGLTPSSLGELGPEIGELAMAWGAAKAMAHRRRHG